MNKKSIYQRVYELALEGNTAKKICRIVKRDKARVSRILKALVDAGFLVCSNPGDRVRFYNATKKKLSPSDDVILSTMVREKTTKKDYGGYYTRCHGVSFKSDVKRWGKVIKWDKMWVTRGCEHFIYRYPFARLGDVCFTRIVSKSCDTLRVDIPPVRWNVVRGNPDKFLLGVARKVLGWFCVRYDVSLGGLVKCQGDKHGLVVRRDDLVKVAQERTIVWSNGMELDASHGVPEFEGSWDVLSELLTLPDRVSKLERDMEKVVCSVERLTVAVDKLVRIFDVPSRIDERLDVT